MTDLEWFNKEIEYYKQKRDKIVEWYVYLIEHNGNYVQMERAKKERDAINNYIDNLQQIKAKLEAWEVIKPNIEDIKAQQSIIIHNVFENKHYQTIKKALEVEDE